jgi:hypothetical protein
MCNLNAETIQLLDEARPALDDGNHILDLLRMGQSAEALEHTDLMMIRLLKQQPIPPKRWLEWCERVRTTIQKPTLAQQEMTMSDGRRDECGRGKAPFGTTHEARDVEKNRTFAEHYGGKEVTVGGLPALNPKEYQPLAARTECVQYASRHRMFGFRNQPIPTINLSNNDDTLRPIRVNHCVIGMTGEIGELAELHLSSREFDRAQLTLEFGDLFWYMAEGMNALGFNMQTLAANYVDVMDLRINDFKERYATAMLGLSATLGRMASELQRWIYYGKYDGEDHTGTPKFDTFMSNMAYQFRVLLGWVRSIFSIVGLDLGNVLHLNIEKLKVRYPEKYTDQQALNRDTKAEEAVAATTFPEPDQPRQRRVPDVPRVIATGAPERVVQETVEEVTLGVLTNKVYNPYNPNGCSTAAELDADVAAGKPEVFKPVALTCKLVDTARPNKCQYCDKPPTRAVSWKQGAFGKPGPVVVPWCGECSLKDALAKRGMTAPVVEGEDYTVEVPKVLEHEKMVGPEVPQGSGTNPPAHDYQ